MYMLPFFFLFFLGGGEGEPRDLSFMSFEKQMGELFENYSIGLELTTF